jgi:hypothetical protein
MLTGTDASRVGSHDGRADAISSVPERQSAQTVAGETSRGSVRPDTLALVPRNECHVDLEMCVTQTVSKQAARNPGR